MRLCEVSIFPPNRVLERSRSRSWEDLYREVVTVRLSSLQAQDALKAQYREEYDQEADEYERTVKPQELKDLASFRRFKFSLQNRPSCVSKYSCVSYSVVSLPGGGVARLRARDQAHRRASAQIRVRAAHPAQPAARFRALRCFINSKDQKLVKAFGLCVATLFRVAARARESSLSRFDRGPTRLSRRTECRKAQPPANFSERLMTSEVHAWRRPGTRGERTR